RDDLSTWLSRELLDAAVDRGVFVRAPAPDINYIAGCDASGGRNDSFTAAISHRESDGKIVLDVLYERRSPFNPSEVVAEIVALMRQYRCTKIVGDKYGAQWKSRRLRELGRDMSRPSWTVMNTLPIFLEGRAPYAVKIHGSALG